MSRFHVGDLVVVVVAAGPRTAALLGEVAEVVAVNVKQGQELLDGPVCWDADYALHGPGGERLLAMDYQLAPRGGSPEVELQCAEVTV